MLESRSVPFSIENDGAYERPAVQDLGQHIED